MFSDCKMAQAVVAEAEGAGYRLDILAAPMLCVDPSLAQDLWPYAGVLRVTNTGSVPIEIAHHTGETGGFSFRGDRVAEPRDPTDAIDYDTGPINFDAGGVVQVQVAPGGSADVVGDPRYILTAIDLAQSGQRPSGAAVEPDERFDRTFRIEFLVDVTIATGGTKTVIQQAMPAMLRIVVRDVSRE